MCGIVGYIGNNNDAKSVLLSGLKKLEYRGYDSAGLSVINKNKIKTIKNKGRITNLENLVETFNITSNIGIAHTRWATHGKPSAINSHPHNDNSNKFSIVHNGIIENYCEIKDFLIKNNYTFKSETDSEVIPNLISYYFSKTNSFIESVNKACNDLKGSYAIAVISSYFPDEIIVAKKDSPLVIGKGINEIFISSDLFTYSNYTDNFYILDDFEIAQIKLNEINFFDKNMNKINKQLEKIKNENKNNEKNEFEDFMLKEIFEQPNSIKNTIQPHFNDKNECMFPELNFSKKFLQTINKIYIIACGTAMHAGLTAKNMFQNICKIDTEVDVASEFRYRNPLINPHTLCIFISQSGETADTIAALKLAISQNATTLAITNVIKSSITRESDYVIYTHAGQEIAVASTKAYTAQISILALLATYFAEILEKDKNLINDLKKSIIELPLKVNECLLNSDAIKKIAEDNFKKKDIFFIGRNLDYNTAVEGSLKLKEISYIHSEAFYSGELKHGPIALIDQNSLVISIITVSELLQKSISNVQEVISRGANTLIITDKNLESENSQIIKIPTTNNFLTPVLSIIPLQFLAYYITKAKGLDVDKPRNLAKSVTVE